MSINSFESSVNSEGIETTCNSISPGGVFESSVNSEGIETLNNIINTKTCLRAV